VSKGGPVTQAGKEVVKWNATRHGISSPAPVVPGLEQPQDWQEHREGILENLSPVGHLEFTLAERVALICWRLHRVTRFETGAIAIAQEKIEEDIHDKRRLMASLRGERFAETHPEDIRWLARYRKPITPSGASPLILRTKFSTGRTPPRWCAEYSTQQTRGRARG
jgi:hypothetical protein